MEPVYENYGRNDYDRRERRERRRERRQRRKMRHRIRNLKRLVIAVYFVSFFIAASVSCKVLFNYDVKRTEALVQWITDRITNEMKVGAILYTSMGIFILFCLILYFTLVLFKKMINAAIKVFCLSCMFIIFFLFINYYTYIKQASEVFILLLKNAEQNKTNVFEGFIS